MEAEKKSNPGYRAFFANGDNATRALVLFAWEVILEWTAARAGSPSRRPAARAPLRHLPLDASRRLRLRARPDRLGRARPTSCAAIPPSTRPFRSYDEVAHHSGLERADTLEALRKLDDKFDEIERLRYAPPYEIVVLSDHGRTEGATFKQRNGHGLDDLVERSLAQGARPGSLGRRAERDGRKRGQRRHWEAGEAAKNDVPSGDVVVLGSATSASST